MALNFPNSPSDGDLSSQPNGITYQWQAAKSRWISISTLGASSTVISTSMVAAFPIDNPPDPAWLYCNGQAVSRETYSILFAVLGTTYGVGDGSTTFNLPDYRGLFHRAQDDGKGVDPDAASRVALTPAIPAGDNVGSYQGHQFQAHTHSIPQRVNEGSPYAAPAGGRSGVGPDSVTGLNGGNETRPVNQYVRYYIYSGLGLVTKEPPAAGTSVQYVEQMTNQWIGSSTIIPLDDSIPQITEGAPMILTPLAFTPKYANSLLKVEAQISMGTVNADGILGIFALFESGASDAFGATAIPYNASRWNGPATFSAIYQVSSLNTLNFSCRYGPGSVGSVFLNGNNGLRQLGGSSRCGISVTEIAQ